MKGRRLYSATVLAVALSVFLPAPVARAQEEVLDFRCQLDMGGEIPITFEACSGIGSETEVVDQKVMGPKGSPVVIKVPGRLHWLDITLKRGMGPDRSLWDWRKMVVDGAIQEARRNVTIYLLNYKMEVVARWEIKNAWPTRIEGPQKDVFHPEQAIEILVLTHEGATRTQ